MVKKPSFYISVTVHFDLFSCSIVYKSATQIFMSGTRKMAGLVCISALLPPLPTAFPPSPRG